MRSAILRSVTNSGETIATLLHAFLVREGMTDAGLAELIGADQTQISRWRRGAHVPRSAWIPVIAETLGLDEETVEAARVEGERVRRENLGKIHSTDPREELRRTREELRRAKAKIARLEERLRRGR
jgi:transposase-like protein